MPDLHPAGQAFRLPAWTPGSYLIREFARHFVDVRAECAGAPVAVRKTSRDVWQVAPCIGSVSLIAEVYAFDLSVRAAYPDQTRGYFNGPSVFVWLVEHEERPCDVEIIAPMSDACHNWRFATSLPRSGAEPYGSGRYAAANYDELIDYPVEMGSFMLADFEAGGARHDIAVSGRHRGDLERLARDLARLAQSQIDLFGGAPVSRVPFDYYLFQVLAAEAARGGLEHRASTSLVCKRDELPQPGARGVSEEYRDLLGLASHEYFHIWNVKRIKPAAFVPYDLTRENYTAQLWALEGDRVLLRRSDARPLRPDRGVRLPGARRPQLHDAAPHPWPSEATRRGVELRGNRRRAFGLDLSAFFADYVCGTRELPLAELLRSFAVDLNLRPRERDKDSFDLTLEAAPQDTSS